MADVRFVYFDLGNVLVSFDPKVACRNVAERFDVTIEAAEQAIYTSGLQDEFEHGRIDGPSYAKRLAESLSMDPNRWPVSDWLDAISDMFVPIDGMCDAFDGLLARYIPFGLLSNTCVAHWDWITRQRWAVTDRRFHPMILSCDVGSMKPDPGIYIAAESQAHRVARVSPGEILFLDDREENVLAALQRGWHAVQCIGGHPACDVLREFGLID
ncbi:HAD family hydrolase [Stieleria varia]|uniref:D-glucose-1-phosphatase n=1 Tax=Stieleria varia TaxID=2528005 RepID=A0A5C6ARM4_9BACT|nr:HAD family phosphatase [Stieleria varia]TWU02151.1 D-glucose-1-phosphatase [Stieleria varia]